MENLVHCLKKHCAKVSEDCEGKLYCGITLDWNYIERWVDISMPGYIKRLCQRYEHIYPKKTQHSSYRARPKIYGAAAQDSMPTDDPTLIDDERKKLVQHIIGDVLYYVRAVDLTVLPALSSIASGQRYEHISPKKIQHSPYRVQPNIYGAAAQDSMPTDDSPLINDERKNWSNKSSVVFCITEGQWI